GDRIRKLLQRARKTSEAKGSSISPQLIEKVPQSSANHPMKILYHHRIRSKDGQYVHLEELTAAFARMGHQIILVGPRAVEKEEFGSGAGIVASLKKHLPKFVYEMLELGYAIPAFLRLWKAALRHRP